MDLLDDDRFRESDIYQRRQLHFLGSIQLSLDTLKQTNRVEGTFEMNTPLFILGYDKQSQTKEQVIDISPRSTTDGRDSTYLNLFVTLIPSLNANNNSPVSKFLKVWLPPSKIIDEGSVFRTRKKNNR